ncbi:MAG: hypothetical protein ABS62_03720 [Microbacterium sp. SCN 70-200]|uniref:ABC transporter permease n=1 Tax=unclassified Microbacterium TaxID=2609290 RepID=UPI00086C4A9B|nr:MULTISPECIES: FtsX-like permease family protein [unclassified Microbacterium]MBN9213662.1 ABC transporter permease [Microbacterium sp.]ODT42193.1 MAG: hypothetical protein ABS62_03720 [Microbacterium sp. SCN 70-200]OJV79178.1 MAG: hypothetical protein BGO46_02620 [Microbacterium sp. 70-16]
MSTSPGLFALTRRRFATPRSAALVIIALTALAAFVVAAAPRALVGVVRAEVSHQLGGVAPTSRDLSGTALDAPAFGPGDVSTEGWDPGASDVFGAVAEQLENARDGFDPVLRDLTSPAQFAEYKATGLVVVPGDAEPAQPADAPFAVIQLLSEPTATAQMTLVEGAWPQAWDGGDSPIGIVLSADAAATMGWTVGEQRRVPANARNLSDGWWPDAPAFVLAGTFTAVDPAADRWLHLPTALTATVFDDGNSRPRATAAAWVPAGTWERVSGQLGGSQITLWYPVDADAARGVDPTELLAAVRGATSASIPLDESGQLRVRLSSDLETVLSTALGRSGAASAILAVAAVGPLAVSVALIVLAAALIVRRRRTDLALLSARGAPLSRLRRLLLGEGVLLGVPAAVIGAGVGVLVTANDAGWMPTALAVLVGAAPGLALALTLRPALLERGRSDLDAPVRSRWTRIAEAIVGLLAVVAVVQLVLRGVGSGTTTIDPLVIAAPLLATVALALIVVRLHPLPIAAAFAAAKRGRGVVGLVGAARSLRDPAAGTTAVLAMVVAVAIAVFSSVVLATVDRGAVVAAQRDVGADIRIAGPYFEQATIDRLREVDGVTDAVGILRGDYLTVTGPGGRASVLALVTEPDRLAAAQRGFVGAFPGGLAAGSDPLQVAVSTAVTEETGGVTTVQNRPAQAVATVDELLGMAGTSEFVVLAASDYTALTGLGFYPRTVLVDITAGADVHAVADALSEIIGQNHTVRFLTDSTAEIQASPAVTALRFVLLSALGVAGLLSVIALLLVAGVARDARSRVIALLRTMGLDRRRARGIVAWEFAPLGITALVGGMILGAVLPLLVVVSIDLRPFTGGGAQPALTVDPLLSGSLIAAVIVALGIAVVAGVASARTTSIATVLRTEED